MLCRKVTVHAHRILALHVNRLFPTNGGFAAELTEVSRALDDGIDVGYEGMELHV